MKSLVLLVACCLSLGDGPQTDMSRPRSGREKFADLILPARAMLPAGPHQERPLTYLPNGPYRNGSTRNYKIMLNCSCKNSAGIPVDASMDLTRLTNMNNYLVNVNGVLKSEGGKKEQPTTFTPVGTYLNSCEVKSVMLSAEAKKDNGQFVPASIDMKGVPVTAQLQNIDGVLSFK